MAVDELQTGIPRWAAVALLAAIGVSFFYGIVVMQSIAAPLRLWTGIGTVALALFVVYLLWRFVVAVETIAEKL